MGRCKKTICEEIGRTRTQAADVLLGVFFEGGGQVRVNFWRNDNNGTSDTSDDRLLN